MGDGQADNPTGGVAGLEAALEAVAASAHDLNNTITAVIGHAALLRKKIRKDDPSYADLEGISLAGARAAEIARELLALGSRRGAATEEIDLGGLVSGMERTLLRLSGDAPLSIECASPGFLETQRGRVVQLLLALVAEARDTALPGDNLLLRAHDGGDSAVLYLRAGSSFPTPEGLVSITELSAALGADVRRVDERGGAALRVSIPRRASVS